MANWFYRSLACSAVAVAAAVMPIAVTGAATTQPTTQAVSPRTQAVIDDAQVVADKAFAYLKAQEKPDFSWQSEQDPPGLSALVLKAFVEDEKYDPDMVFLDKGFDKLISYQKPDGGVYIDSLQNYNTAIAISAMAVSKEAEYKAPIAKALAFLRTLQFSDTIQGDLHVTPDDVRYGGTGYGKGGRPDLSNLGMTLDALHDAGIPPTDPAYAAALKFVTRCQNLSETNDQKWASNDGGFIYTPFAGGVSPAGDYVDASGVTRHRSYGSMTYTAIKSMIYAGLTRDDPRVKAAWDWLSKNYTVKENPGMQLSDPNDPNAAKGGLYYYYHAMARALHAYGSPTITDAAGVTHDWRVDLIAQIKTLQAADGSFKGEKQFMEDNPVLATGYVALAMEEVKLDLHDHPVAAN
jgi:squalene-hopene/tetraprenyl-beta-curcumene cyclase